DDGELVRHLRQTWEVFANLNARDLGGNRLELAPDFQRRVHLQIEHILVRRSAGQINHDDRFVRIADAGPGFGLEKLRQGEPAETKRADPQKIPPGDAVAETGFIAVDGEHRVKVNDE